MKHTSGIAGVLAHRFPRSYRGFKGNVFPIGTNFGGKAESQSLDYSWITLRMVFLRCRDSLELLRQTDSDIGLPVYTEVLIPAELRGRY